MKLKFSLLVWPLGLTALLAYSGCEPEIGSVSGREYAIQCLWTGGPNDFSPNVTFNADGTITHVDDTATIAGTWTENEGNVTWNLSNPPKNTAFRGSFDDKAINGNFEDSQGGEGIFQGSIVK